MNSLQLQESDFVECKDDDGHEYYQLNIQEGFKIKILAQQTAIKKIEGLITSTNNGQESFNVYQLKKIIEELRKI